MVAICDKVGRVTIVDYRKPTDWKCKMVKQEGTKARYSKAYSKIWAPQDPWAALFFFFLTGKRKNDKKKYLLLCFLFSSAFVERCRPLGMLQAAPWASQRHTSPPQNLARRLRAVEHAEHCWVGLFIGRYRRCHQGEGVSVGGDGPEPRRWGQPPTRTQASGG